MSNNDFTAIVLLAMASGTTFGIWQKNVSAGFWMAVATVVYCLSHS